MISGANCCYWVIDSINAFITFVRLNERLLCTQGFVTYDFVDMYTMLPHRHILERLRLALEEAWTYKAAKGRLRPPLLAH